MRNKSVERFIFWWIGFFLGRVVIGSYNPMAVAGFASLFFTGDGFASQRGYEVPWYMSGQRKRKETLQNLTGVLLGMAMVSPVWSCLRYGISIVLIGILYYWIRLKENQRIKKGVIASLVLFFVSLGFYFFQDVSFFSIPFGRIFSGNTENILLLFSLEAVLTLTFTVIFSTGIAYLKKREQTVEAATGFAFLLASVLSGLFLLQNDWFSFPLACIYFTLLYMGYCHGSAVGAAYGVFLAGLLGLSGGEIKETVFVEIGIYAFGGLLSGFLRKAGPILSSAFFSVFMLFCKSRILVDSGISEYTSLGIAVLLFLVIPFQYKKSMELKQEEAAQEFGGLLYRERAVLRAHELSSVFQGIARTFSGIVKEKEKKSREEEGHLLKRIEEYTCKSCSGKERCARCDPEKERKMWEMLSEQILSVAENGGEFTARQVPVAFEETCCNMEHYLAVVNQEIFAERLNRYWRNRVLENREAVSEQLQEISKVIAGFEEDLTKEQGFMLEEKGELKQALAKKKIELLDVISLVGKQRQREIYLRVRSKRGNLLPCRELVSVVGQVFAHPFRLKEENRNIISKKPQFVSLVEEVNFKVITGISKCAKDGGVISGDNFSSLATEKGMVLLSISDGMGSGDPANEESRAALDLLEQFLEAGFDVEAAVRLINSVMLFKTEREAFSTLDISLINLYTGICKFVKTGGAATYIRRERSVERIDSNSFPIGVWNKIEIDTSIKKLYDGDMVIMVSDGVLEGISKNTVSGESQEIAATAEEKMSGFTTLEEQLLKWTTQNPKELSKRILQLALSEDGTGEDDMMVMVSGIWNR